LRRICFGVPGHYEISKWNLEKEKNKKGSQRDKNPPEAYRRTISENSFSCPLRAQIPALLSRNGDSIISSWYHPLKRV
jgi:hypothetical protein